MMHTKGAACRQSRSTLIGLAYLWGWEDMNFQNKDSHYEVDGITEF
jgi:hypothetical protein